MPYKQYKARHSKRKRRSRPGDKRRRLFFHRRLRRLIAINLKLGRFQAADKGQMELYLQWLENHEQLPGEEPSIGLILCADKSEEHIELLQLDRSSKRVAEYLTELPPRPVLESKLHAAIEAAAR